MKWKILVKVKYIKYNRLNTPNDSEGEFHNIFNQEIKKNYYESKK